MPFTALLVLAAAPFADLGAIDLAVAQFTGAGVGEPGGAMQPIDRRLRLAACTSTPSLSWRGERRDAVAVTCGDPGGWGLYVPVRAEPQAAAIAAVNRGDAVIVSVAGEGFSVSQPGEALDAAPVGGWVRVKLASTGVKAQAMRAQVVRPGLVEIPLP